MRVLITSFNVSRRMGGEAVLPLHYARELRALIHLDVHVQTHARVRDELKNSEIWDEERTHFIEDSLVERAIHTIGKAAPGAIRETVFISAISAVTMTTPRRRGAAPGARYRSRHHSSAGAGVAAFPVIPDRYASARGDRPAQWRDELSARI
ncbi:MAG: hypothetical protein R3C40_00805 [Parvularculaceae bacterium]